jgi:hypothetical protein
MLGYCHGGVGFQPLRVWIIGLCERERGGRVICRCLYDRRRNSETCVNFISDYCKLGTTIWSDGWRAYQCLTRERYAGGEVGVACCSRGVP